MGKPFQKLRRKRYESTEPGYQSYLQFVNKRVGIIKDKTTAERLGGIFDDATMAQSQYSPEKLFDALRVYDRAYQWQPDSRLLSIAYNAVKARFSELDKKLIPLEVEEVLHYATSTASAGAPYFKKKGEVLKSGYRYDKARVGQYPCVAYFRTQSRQNSDGSFSPKQRLVWGFPLDQTVAEGKYARSAITALMRIKTPYPIGLRKSQIAARLNAFKWAPLVGSFDWSKFDATIPKQLISMAFRIVRGWFVDETVDEAEWNAIVKYFCCTPILMPDGRVYFGKTDGIPSGSYFTGIVGSICNLLLIEYLIREQGGLIRDVLVMGDDSVIALNQALDIKRMSQVARLCFGVELHPEKQRYTRYDHDLSFLSHTWCNGRAERPVEVSRAKAVYSERGWAKGSDIHSMRLDRIVSLYGDNPRFWPVVKGWLREEGVIRLDSTRMKGVIISSFTDKTREVTGRRSRIVPLALATYV